MSPQSDDGRTVPSGGMEVGSNRLGTPAAAISPTMPVPDMWRWLSAPQFQYHERAFDPLDDDIGAQVHDIMRGSRMCKKISMGCAILAHQLPMPTLKPALTLAEARTQLGVVASDEVWTCNGTEYVCVQAGSERFVVSVPEVWTISTRPNCRKDDINPRYDLVRYGLKNEHLLLETSCEGNVGVEAEPSDEALLVMAHAFTNAILGSVLGRWEPGSPFFHRLKQRGMALLHWHGFMPEGKMPFGYFVQYSPAPKSTAKTMQGKLEMLGGGAEKALYHQGDIYIEQLHGTTINCPSLEAFIHRHLLP